MKYKLLIITAVALSSIAQLKTIELPNPSKGRGLPVMDALAVRASQSEFDSTALELQDLSDLLWAANGVNRPDEGKRTAPSATNAQDIDIYVFSVAGVHLYNAREHLLEPVVNGDHRLLIAGRQPAHAEAPVILLLVSDISRFRSGDDQRRLSMGAMDAGIVSQNIAIFCAGVGLATRPRAQMDHAGLRELLELSESQHPFLNNPVSYMK